MFSLEGKKVILTGGSGILGSAISNSIIKQKGEVVIVDLHNSEKPKKENNNKKFFYRCDLSKSDDIVDVFQKILSDHPDVNCLFNNAASKSDNVKKFFKRAEDFDINTWNHIMDVNLTSVFLTCKIVFKHWKKLKTKGIILNTSSIYGSIAPNESIYEGSKYLGSKINTPPVYSASKSGLNGLTKYLASYWGKYNIRVNAISPGGIESGQSKEFVKNYSKNVPMKRMGSIDEISGAAIFLLSDESSYITGQNILIDGGMSIW